MVLGTKLFIAMFIFGYSILLGPLTGVAMFCNSLETPMRTVVIQGAIADLVIMLAISSNFTHMIGVG